MDFSNVFRSSALTQKHLLRACLLAALGLFCVGCLSTQGAKAIALTAPDASVQQLTQLGGQAFDLPKELRSHKATVLFWWATKCPCVKRYQRRMEQLAKHFSHQQVAFHAIASNADDTPTRIKQVASQRRFRLPILLDPHARFARYLRVRSTPTAVLLDQRGRVRYIGWIDNERRLGASGRTPYLRTALDAVLTKKPVVQPQTTMLGCDITRSLFAQPSPKQHTKKAQTSKTTSKKKSSDCQCKQKKKAPPTIRTATMTNTR